MRRCLTFALVALLGLSIDAADRLRPTVHLHKRPTDAIEPAAAAIQAIQKRKAAIQARMPPEIRARQSNEPVALKASRARPVLREAEPVRAEARILTIDALV